jgi:hypothetical protein
MDKPGKLLAISPSRRYYDLGGRLLLLNPYAQVIPAVGLSPAKFPALPGLAELNPYLPTLDDCHCRLPQYQPIHPVWVEGIGAAAVKHAALKGSVVSTPGELTFPLAEALEVFPPP